MKSKLILSIDDFSKKFIVSESQVAILEDFDIYIENLPTSTSNTQYAIEEVSIEIFDFNKSSIFSLKAVGEFTEEGYRIEGLKINSTQAVKTFRLAPRAQRMVMTLWITYSVTTTDGETSEATVETINTYYGNAFVKIHNAPTTDGTEVHEAVTRIEQHNADPNAHSELFNGVGEEIETLHTTITNEVAARILQEETNRNNAINLAIKEQGLDNIKTLVDGAAKSASAAAISAEAAGKTLDEVSALAVATKENKEAVEGLTKENEEILDDVASKKIDVDAKVAQFNSTYAEATTNIENFKNTSAKANRELEEAKSTALNALEDKEAEVVSSVASVGAQEVAKLHAKGDEEFDALEDLAATLANNLENSLAGFDAKVDVAITDINNTSTTAITKVVNAQTTAESAIEDAKEEAIEEIELDTQGSLEAITNVTNSGITSIARETTEATTTITTQTNAFTTQLAVEKQDIADAVEDAETAASNASTSASSAATSATSASTSASKAASALVDVEEAVAEINAQAASIGYLLVKSGCPINIEQRDGAICQVRCMGEDRFMPACDGVYYSITTSTKTYFLDKNLNVVKVFNKTFGYYSFHDYAVCGTGTLIVRDGLIWYSNNSTLYVADWETGNVLASLSGYHSVVHNGLSGNLVAVTSNGLIAATVGYDTENNAIIVNSTYETGFPFTRTDFCFVHPYHMGKFTFVHLVQYYSFFGTKIYALNANDMFEEISTDTDGDPILFNCTATAAGFEGDEYTNQYASQNPGYYWTGNTFADSDGTSHQAFTLTNGLQIWVTSGTTMEGVPVFAKFNFCYGNKKGIVYGYPWQGAHPNTRIPTAISCGCRNVFRPGYFYGCVLSGKVETNNIYTPYLFKPSIPFAQTSSGGYNSGASLQEAMASNIVAIYPVAPLRGLFSFGGYWDYLTTTPGMLIDLRQPLV